MGSTDPKSAKKEQLEKNTEYLLIKTQSTVQTQ